MRKIAMLGAAALVACGLAGTAMAADVMAGAYGNTVIVTDAKGGSYKLFINKDGTFKSVTADGKTITGKWSLKDNNTKYCSKADLPDAKETCSEFKGAHKAGDKWQQNDVTGQPITVEIKAGM